MRVRQIPFLLGLLMSALTTGALAAQQSAVAGTVTDAGSGQPLQQVQVAVQGGGQPTGAITSQSGRFTIPVAPGTYTVTATMIGYETRTFEGVQVRAGQPTNLGIALESRAVALDPIQVTVGKKPEKATEAPATVSVVSSARIEEKVVATPIEHMKDVVGVDVINYGLSAGNVVVRGFNNIFSGALHFLTDNRVASIPSLQVNLMQFVPSTDEDIARIEVVLGPGSALYGPNTANGVLHFITRSPLEGSHTSASIAGGERSVFKGAFRTSQLLTPKFGVKLSGSIFKGNEFPFKDSVEVQARRAADANPATFRTTLKALYPTLSDAELTAVAARVGVRDYDILRWGGEARADWRFVDNGTFIVQAGRSSNSGVELTGLGAGQTDNWIYSFYQARMNLGRLFAQTYLNTSDAGESFLLRQGGVLVDKSKMWVAQLQNGTGLLDDRLDFIYGVDYKPTQPESESTIYGQYEDQDEIKEFGAYVQTEIKPIDKVELIGALRYDQSTAMEDPVWSPRAALVFTPVPAQAFRVSYNRAFSTPSTLSLFLDINGGRAPGSLGQLGFLVRATGSGTGGLSFQTGPGTFGGMRSPFTPAALGGPKALLPISSATLWQYAIGFLQARGSITAAQAAALASPQVTTLAAVAVKVNTFDAVTGKVTPLASTVVPDVPRLEPSTTTTWEVGYQGVIADKLGLAADAWWSKRDNFTSPLTLWTPMVSLDRATMQAFLTGVFQQQGLPAAQAAGTAAAIAAGVGSDPVTSAPGAPLAVISSADISTPAGADLITTYVNYGEVDLSGADVSVTAFLTPEWTLGLTGSLVSDDHFRLTPSTTGAKEQIVALNAPEKKGTVTLGYRNSGAGFNAEVRGRFTSQFPANSAGYVGTACVLSATELATARAGGLVEDCVGTASVFDLTAGYHVRNTGASVQLYISNVLDAAYRNFVGVPEIGRLALLQLKYDF
ncbi:MAG: TonB-dependent receptor [Gemmatimonadetes bacterium]|nr:TonB-dependent receptor [Gemmatimonadota bacterium]